MKVFRWLKERFMKVFRKKAESEPGIQMEFFNSAVTILETLVVALVFGLGTSDEVKQQRREMMKKFNRH
ncbi:MAG: hypothetical protein II670_08535 [Alphaproteobacteria bacterium]|nr:hypothetical protein [Alphaproteobacteria bacterium]